MATVTGFTAARMLEIENETIVNGEVVDGDLILETREGTLINAGPVIAAGGTPFVGQYTTAGRPSAATHDEKILWDTDEAAFYISNGVSWSVLSVGGGSLPLDDGGALPTNSMPPDRRVSYSHRALAMALGNSPYAVAKEILVGDSISSLDGSVAGVTDFAHRYEIGMAEIYNSLPMTEGFKPFDLYHALTGTVIGWATKPTAQRTAPGSRHRHRRSSSGRGAAGHHLFRRHRAWREKSRCRAGIAAFLQIHGSGTNHLSHGPRRPGRHGVLACTIGLAQTISFSSPSRMPGMAASAFAT